MNKKERETEVENKETVEGGRRAQCNFWKGNSDAQISNKISKGRSK